MLVLSNIAASIVATTLFFHPLPSESTGINVRTICQDRQGNMWFGGTDGITRYDGSRFTDFRYNVGGESNTRGDHVYKLVCDDDGTVWAGNQSGLSSFDDETGTFRYFDSPDGVIRDIVPLSGDRFLVTANYRLWIFDKGTGLFSWAGMPSSLTGFQASALYCPDDTILYIGGRDGRIFSVSTDLRDCVELQPVPCPYQINCLLTDAPGHFWVGTEGGGLWDFSPGEPGQPRHHGMEFVRSLCVDEEGSLWAGTKNGLFVMRDGRFEEFHYDYFDVGSITHDSVLDIVRDRQGTIWLGTYYGGVCYCTSKPSLFQGIASRPEADYLNGQIISDIVEDTDGSLWIGTNSGGLNHLLTDGRFEHIGGPGKDGTDQPDIKSIHVSRYSGLIIGADKGVLSVLKPGSKRLQPMEPVIQGGSYAIEDGDDGILFVGSGHRVYRLDERTGALSTLLEIDATSYIAALKLTGDGTLWIGHRSGVLAMDPSSGSVLPLPEQLSCARYAVDFLEDSSGRVWISSADGLLCYDGTTVTALTVRDGLPDNVIHGVEEDALERLWISTNKGLCRMDPETGDKWIFTVADGLPGDRFTDYAHCRTRSGEMYFGGLSWIVRFNPESINPSYKQVQPVIVGIEVNGQERSFHGSSIDLEAGDRDISILFSVPDYISGQNGHFFYKLEGEAIKDSWHEAGMDRVASYHGLASGDYTFWLNYRNSAGIEIPESICFAFSIPPHWWETLAFKVVVFFLLAAVVVFVFMKLLARKRAEFQSEMDRVRNELLNEFSLDFVRIGAGKSPDNESTVAKVFYKGDEDFMRKAMQIVKKNLDNPDFSVEALAAGMNMSRSNLHIRSKALFGVSAHEFIKTVRFNEACRLLVEKKLSISEISYMVGFSTPSYFASSFRHFMGCTPSEYAQQNSPGATE